MSTSKTHHVPSVHIPLHDDHDDPSMGGAVVRSVGSRDLGIHSSVEGAHMSASGQRACPGCGAPAPLMFGPMTSGLSITSLFCGDCRDIHDTPVSAAA